MITQNNSITKFIAAGILLIAFTFNVTAQTTANDVIIGRANVLTGITVTGEAPLDFGFVSPGIDKTVQLDGVATPSTSNQVNVSTGRFKVTAGANSAVLLTFTLPATLDQAPSYTLPIDTYTASYNTTAAPVTGATNFNPTTANTPVYSGVFPVGGELYVYLGGTVHPSNTQQSGVYESNITLTATYN